MVIKEFKTSVTKSKESKLHSWLLIQKAQFQLGKLNDEQIAKLKELPDFRIDEFSHEDYNYLILMAKSWKRNAKKEKNTVSYNYFNKLETKLMGLIMMPGSILLDKTDYNAIEVMATSFHEMT